MRDLPAWTPDPVELADLELVLAGVYRPLPGFLGSYDTAMVVAGGGSPTAPRGRSRSR